METKNYFANMKAAAFTCHANYSIIWMLLLGCNKKKEKKKRIVFQVTAIKYYSSIQFPIEIAFEQ